MSKHFTERREIEGVPYTLSLYSLPSGPTMVVCRDARPTDRIHHRHFVALDAQGRPLRCTCGDAIYRGSWCKHLQAVEALKREGEQQQAPPPAMKIEMPELGPVVDVSKTMKGPPPAPEAQAWTDDGKWHQPKSFHPATCRGCTSDSSRWGQQIDPAPVAPPAPEQGPDCDYVLLSPSRRWTWVFEARGDKVHVVRKHDANVAGDAYYDRTEARRLARWLRENGWRTAAEKAQEAGV
jgi:hypothetical protein